MAKTKMTWIAKLGLEPVDKLTKQVCKQRVSVLKKNIKAGKYTGQALKQAKYYAAWYDWRSSNSRSTPK